MTLRTMESVGGGGGGGVRPKKNGAPLATRPALPKRSSASSMLSKEAIISRLTSYSLSSSALLRCTRTTFCVSPLTFMLT